jgi:uncharacterized membrane protein
MEIAGVTENTVVTGSDGGRNVANVIYVLYIIGFFVGVTALIGVILAYVNRTAASSVFKSHMTFQIKIFWRGIIVIVVNTVLYLVISALGIVSSAFSFALYIVPIGISLWWLVWTIMAIAKGMGALGRQEIIGH